MQIQYDNTTYILTQDAYIDVIGNDYCYTAIALDSRGHEYRVYWEIFEHFLEKICNVDDYVDESEACDWENPSSVIKL